MHLIQKSCYKTAHTHARSCTDYMNIHNCHFTIWCQTIDAELYHWGVWESDQCKQPKLVAPIQFQFSSNSGLYLKANSEMNLSFGLGRSWSTQKEPVCAQVEHANTHRNALAVWLAGWWIQTLTRVPDLAKIKFRLLAQAVQTSRIQSLVSFNFAKKVKSS